MPALLRISVSILFCAFAVGAAGRPEFSVPRVSAPPVIDGRLDDTEWSQGKLTTDDWLTYNPVRGDKLSQKTDVWITYDDRNLYFAFQCLDPEPGKIKTSVTRRDNQFSDDWVGLSLDAMFNGQVSYDMFVNPNGVQGDILTSSSSGEDSSPDWVWESAGRVTEQGYNVEIRLPFQSIRFKSGSEVKMGLLFWRRVSRLGSSASWPALPAGKSVFECHATARFEDLKQPRTIELIPSLTYAYTQYRETPTAWSTIDSKPDAGVTVKYGITSSITAETTINPDFSQVESDAYQVEVNQRYPIFFSEKRPFFMEGMGLFSLAGSSGDGNLATSVHTRKIVDPLWGLKLTGTAGRFSFGTLSAADQSPGREIEGTINPLLGDSRYFNIARGMFSLGKGTYIGAMVTDTELGSEYNRTLSSDVSLRMGEYQNLSGTFIGTMSRGAETGRTSGVGMQAMYGYNTDKMNIIAQAEHYDDDFQMDTAFYNQVGITRGWAFSDYSFYPDKEKYPWIRRISPLVFIQTGKDRIEGGNAFLGVVGVNFRFTRQGFLRLDMAKGEEPWAGRKFDASWKRIIAEAQITRWLRPFFQIRAGDGIYYDRSDPFQGKSNRLSSGITFQPSARISQDVSWSRENFDRASNNEHVYTVNILNTRSTYQFSRNLYVRAILQFDSSRRSVLTDLLGSYELVPGTVAFFGYGSLFNRQSWQDGRWTDEQGEYLTTRRGIFFKVSYLQRF